MIAGWSFITLNCSGFMFHLNICGGTWRGTLAKRAHHCKMSVCVWTTCTVCIRKEADGTSNVECRVCCVQGQWEEIKEITIASWGNDTDTQGKHAKSPEMSRFDRLPWCEKTMWVVRWSDNKSKQLGGRSKKTAYGNLSRCAASNLSKLLQVSLCFSSFCFFFPCNSFSFLHKLKLAVHYCHQLFIFSFVPKNNLPSASLFFIYHKCWSHTLTNQTVFMNSLWDETGRNGGK